MIGKYKILDELQAADEVDLRAWEREIIRINIQKLSPEERAYKYIRWYFDLENPTKEEYGEFKAWLTSHYSIEAKDRALQRVFFENVQFHIACRAEDKTAEEKKNIFERWSKLAQRLGINQ